MNAKRLIPDFFTCSNLLSGALATLMATQGAYLWAFGLILLGAFFDFFDCASMFWAPASIREAAARRSKIRFIGYGVIMSLVSAGSGPAGRTD